MKRLLTLLCLLALPLTSPGRAQSTDAPSDGTVRTLIPNLVALRRPAQPLTFDLSAGTFPPLEYPVRYLSPGQDYSVFASVASPWTLQLELRGQPDEHGRTLPSTLLSYRINGGPWIKATGTPQVVLSQVGPTRGWQPLRLELALDLTGDEPGGDYNFDLTFTAQVLP